MAFSESPRIQTDAPNSTISLSRNWPGNADMAGKPRLGSHPGVEKRNETVVAKSPIARTPPIADALGNAGRRAINVAVVISITPSILEKSRTLRKSYIQPTAGCARPAAECPSLHTQ